MVMMRISAVLGGDEGDRMGRWVEAVGGVVEELCGQRRGEVDVMMMEKGEVEVEGDQAWFRGARLFGWSPLGKTARRGPGQGSSGALEDMAPCSMLHCGRLEGGEIGTREPAKRKSG